MKENTAENWDIIVKPYSKWYKLNLKEVWDYKDLLFLFVKRDFVSIYKQTILGPLWLFIQPIITTVIYTIIFTYVAKIGTEGVPSILFYLAGITLWTYFSDCLNKTSNTFVLNSGVFGKVYFPRLIMPLSVLISNLIKLGIQLLLFIIIWLYYLFSTNSVHPNIYILLTPFLLLIIAGLGLGFGLIISSLTTKYRDLTFLIGFGIQLLMYATPVIYPLSAIPQKYKTIILLNPMTSIIEAFKYAFIGIGFFNWLYILYSLGCMITILFLGIIIFNKVGKSFMDTV